ncbi:MAG: DUF4202 domain-containing protein [Caldilineaceae bacterium]|nr:DUF4202 domain-containing protein [Caldilineaceae bacterium]
MPIDSPRFQQAIARFDAANAADPNREFWQGAEYPKELLYSQRMAGWLQRFAPDASEALRLAVAAQHIRRWESPRRDYPEGKAGYKAWRSNLARFHAETAGEILADVGYDAATIRRVQGLIRKEHLKRDAEAQCLEDVACLVFLESYFADFSQKHDEAKLIDILQKTWKKMSPAGHAAALGLALPAGTREIVEKALAGG